MAATKVVNVKVKYIRPDYDNLKQWCEDDNNVYIGRRGIVFIEGERYPRTASPFANPFKVNKFMTVGESLIKYEHHIREKIKSNHIDLKQLIGKKFRMLVQAQPMSW